jgi:hypothetical protein
MTSSEQPRPVRVLYFAGSGRSGTTVVTNILGQLPGTFAAGELRYLWQRGVGQDHLCGCGQHFSSCPVWSAVMRRVREAATLDDEAPPPDEVDIGRGLLARLRMARLPGTLARHLLGRRPVPGHTDDAMITQLYRAIAAETGGAVIIDSSKLPPYGLLLSSLPDVELSVIHLVRDPRATAYSWLRSKPSRDTEDAGDMQRQQTWKSAILWTVWNLTAAVVWGDDDPRVCRIRYEDFVSDPEGQLARVATMIGAEPAALPFLGPDLVRLAPTHSVAGNPNRHDAGVVRLRPDDEWRTSMRRWDRTLVTLLTTPGLQRFRYPINTHTPPRPQGSRPLSTRHTRSADPTR